MLVAEGIGLRHVRYAREGEHSQRELSSPLRAIRELSFDYLITLSAPEILQVYQIIYLYKCPGCVRSKPTLKQYLHN